MDLNELKQVFPELPEAPSKEQIQKAIMKAELRKALKESSQSLYRALDEMDKTLTDVVGDAVILGEKEFIRKWGEN